MERTADRPPVGAESRAAPPAEAPRRLRVLVADDERAIAVTLGDAIGAAGHEVAVVRDGTAAVRALDGGGFDVVVSDVRMPGLDGMAVLRHARARAPDIEVILMTGFGTDESALEAMRAGALYFVRKPFYNEAILGLLERIGQSSVREPGDAP